MTITNKAIIIVKIIERSKPLQRFPRQKIPIKVKLNDKQKEEYGKINDLQFFVNK